MNPKPINPKHKPQVLFQCSGRPVSEHARGPAGRGSVFVVGSLCSYFVGREVGESH